MYVIVSPSISRDDLVKLAQDLLATHRNAKVLNVRILDSGEAATYDKQVDGGQLTREHLVAEVRRNEMQESESIRIRGVEIDPKTGAPLPEKPRTQPPAAPGAN